MYAFIVMYWLFAALSLKADERITLSFDESVCFPGDLVELRAEAIFESYQTFELLFPKNPNFHVVARRQEPTLLHDNSFAQTEVWVLQPKTSGSLELSALRAQIHSGDSSEEIALSPITLQVKEYKNLDTAEFRPEAFPTPPNEIESFASITSVIVFGIILITALVLIFRRKAVFQGPSPHKHEEPQMALIKTALSQGSLPISDIEKLLNSPEVPMPSSTRTALEEAIYRPGADASTLLRLLEKKAQ